MLLLLLLSFMISLYKSDQFFAWSGLTYFFSRISSHSLMQVSIDTTDVDRGPVVDNKIEIALYYIFFVVVFSFFFLNIFVALIILTFQEQGEKEQGECELDRNQVSDENIVQHSKHTRWILPWCKTNCQIIWLHFLCSYCLSSV